MLSSKKHGWDSPGVLAEPSPFPLPSRIWHPYPQSFFLAKTPKIKETGANRVSVNLLVQPSGSAKPTETHLPLPISAPVPDANEVMSLGKRASDLLLVSFHG